MRPKNIEPDHEAIALANYDRRLGHLALFEEMMSFVDDGTCTLEQAIEQYKHDAAVGEYGET